jgi:hypothetical protein
LVPQPFAVVSALRERQAPRGVERHEALILAVVDERPERCGGRRRQDALRAALSDGGREERAARVRVAGAEAELLEVVDVLLRARVGVWGRRDPLRREAGNGVERNARGCLGRV